MSSAAINEECQECGIKDYCMNWCGCTNYYSTGHYNVVGPFICSSEKASINIALKLIQSMEDYGLNFSDHLAGTPLMNIMALR
jgi:sulfatase maturation enzyme AslB (radical SAM superfamily)